MKSCGSSVNKATDRKQREDFTFIDFRLVSEPGRKGEYFDEVKYLHRAAVVPSQAELFSVLTSSLWFALKHRLLSDLCVFSLWCGTHGH